MASELKPLICNQCGGTIDRRTMRCPYCDTQYEQKHDGVLVNYVVERPGVHRICGEVLVDESMVRGNEEAATKYVLDKMRDQIAKGLLDYMRMETETDYRRCCRIIRGEVKVLDPSWEVD